MEDEAWVRVEIACAEVTNEELREVRERDVVIPDAWSLRPDENATGVAVLVFDDGRRFELGMTLDGDVWRALVVAESPARQGDQESLQVNLAHRWYDKREQRRVAVGEALALGIGRRDPLVLTLRGRVFGEGRMIEVDGTAAVQITRLVQ